MRGTRANVNNSNNDQANTRLRGFYFIFFFFFFFFSSSLVARYRARIFLFPFLPISFFSFLSNVSRSPKAWPDFCLQRAQPVSVLLAEKEKGGERRTLNILLRALRPRVCRVSSAFVPFRTPLREGSIYLAAGCTETGRPRR